MDWAAIQTQIAAAVSSASGEAIDVTWTALPQGFRPDRHCYLEVVSFEAYGRPEHRRVDAGGTLEQRVYEPRGLTVQVTIETQNQSLALSSLEIADTIRTALYREDIRDTLASSAGIGIATISALRTLAFPAYRHRARDSASSSDAHGRFRSFCSFDIRFNAHTSSAARAIDYVAEVTGQGVLDSGGATAVVPFRALLEDP